MTSRIRLHNVHVPYGASLEDIQRAAAAKLEGTPRTLEGFALVRRSLDTRRRPRILWSLAVEFDGDESSIAHLPANEASVVETKELLPATPGPERLASRPLVVGAGPAGLFAALCLAENGYRPLVLERGKAIGERDVDVALLMEEGKVDAESNLLFGEGGAGAYSDGKLTTRVSNPRMRKVLETLVKCGADDSILIDARPHIGSDILPGIVTALRRRIEGLGAEFRSGFKVERLSLDAGGTVQGVVSSHDETVAGSPVVLAAGASAHALVAALHGQRVSLEAKPFQVGVRIEHPQEIIDMAVYARERGELPPAEYIASARASARARGVASFCMCPGGIIVPAVSEKGRLSINGMSDSERGGKFANSALVVTVMPEDLKVEGPLGGLSFQETLEKRAFDVGGDYRAPAQKASDFLSGRESRCLPESSYPLGLVSARLAGILPDFLTSSLKAALPVLGRKMPGFIENGTLVAVESRVSSPVRIVRDKESRESQSTPGLYPAGEGAGYAGGIMTSAVDGMSAAEAIIRRFSRPEAERRG